MSVRMRDTVQTAVQLAVMRGRRRRRSAAVAEDDLRRLARQAPGGARDDAAIDRPSRPCGGW
jgi:hypothetical protein